MTRSIATLASPRHKSICLKSYLKNPIEMTECRRLIKYRNVACALASSIKRLVEGSRTGGGTLGLSDTIWLLAFWDSVSRTWTRAQPEPVETADVTDLPAVMESRLLWSL
jgi:ribosomal protein L40E